MQLANTNDPRVIKHRAFTLVELLVVIAIISVLMAMIGVATMGMIGGAKVAATKSTLTKVQGMLQQRVDAVIRKAPDKTLVDSLVPQFGNRKVAELMARKFIFRRAFPQTWAEIATFYPQLLTLSGESAPASTSLNCESSEVLYFLLARANVLGYPPEGTGAFLSSEVQDTDKNGKLELVDTWGNPLRFYRWPTRLIRGGPWSASPFTPSVAARALIPSLPTTSMDLMHDSDDRFGLATMGGSIRLQKGQGLFWTASDPNIFEQGGAPKAGPGSQFFNLGPFHTAHTYCVPLIVSAGPDGSTGLFEPGDTANFGNLAAVDPSAGNAVLDDLTNYNVRAGGK